MAMAFNADERISLAIDVTGDTVAKRKVPSLPGYHILAHLCRTSMSEVSRPALPAVSWGGRLQRRLILQDDGQQ